MYPDLEQGRLVFGSEEAPCVRGAFSYDGQVTWPLIYSHDLLWQANKNRNNLLDRLAGKDPRHPEITFDDALDIFVDIERHDKVIENLGAVVTDLENTGVIRRFDH